MVNQPPHKPEEQILGIGTNKILKDILDVANQSLTAEKALLVNADKQLDIAQQTLTAAQAGTVLLKQINDTLAGFAHNYTVQVEQIVVTRPKS
jgi:hypothetical protein